MGQWVSRAAALPCVLGTWKWAKRLMEQVLLLHLSFYSEKNLKGMLYEQLWRRGGRHSSGISVTVISAN